MNSSILIIVVFLIALFVLPLWLGRWRTTRAAKQVIDAFVQRGAIGPKNAKTLEELGLARRGFGLFLTRDYRQMALMALIRSNTVEQTDDGKYYLTQEAYNIYMSAPGKTRR